MKENIFVVPIDIYEAIQLLKEEYLYEMCKLDNKMNSPRHLNEV